MRRPRPTNWACRQMYRSLWRAVVWAFSSWPWGSVDFPASSSSSHKAVFVDSEVNKGRLKLNTGSSKGETVKILREGDDLFREGCLKSPTPRLASESRDCLVFSKQTVSPVSLRFFVVASFSLFFFVALWLFHQNGTLIHCEIQLMFYVYYTGTDVAFSRPNVF